MSFLLARLKEPTTWQGLTAVITGFGIAMSPELAAAIGAAGVGVFGLVSVVMKERGAEDA